jgi:tetratricopeptide (TPR) repeat protein
MVSTRTRGLAVGIWLAMPGAVISTLTATMPTFVHAAGADDGAGVGARVILRSWSATLKVADKVVARGDIQRVYRVDRVSGPWLWLVADDVRGWVKDEEVIPFDRAIDHFTAEILRQPKGSWAYQMRALIWYDRGDYDKALADGDEAIKCDPGDAMAYQNRGNVFFARKEYALAIADYNEATKIDPSDVVTYENRARAWGALNEHELAIADLNEAVRLAPKNLGLYQRRAEIWAAQRQYDRALADYASILQQAPNNVAALNGRAWILATCPDDKLRSGVQAITTATRACILTGWKDPYDLGTLAAAYAEGGDFAAAVKWQARALDLFPEDDPGRDEHGRRLALYRGGKPWRDAPATPR